MLQISLVLHHCYCCCYFTAHASQKSKRAFVRCLRNTIGYQAFFKRRSNQSDWVCPSEETSPVSLHSSVTDSLCLSSWLFSHHSSYSSATWWLIMFSSVSISPFSLFSLSLFLMESNDSLLSDFSISIAKCLAQTQTAEKPRELSTQRAFNPNFSLQLASSVIFILTEKHLPHQNTSRDGGISYIRGCFCWS